MNSDSTKPANQPEDACASFLEQDFAQCFAQMRHHDAQILDICKFMFIAYTALVGAAVALFELAVEKHLNMRPAAGMAVGVGLLIGVLLFCLTIRNRVYFVIVARYVNETRRAFLSKHPLGFQRFYQFQDTADIVDAG